MHVFLKLIYFSFLVSLLGPQDLAYGACFQEARERQISVAELLRVSRPFLEELDLPGVSGASLEPLFVSARNVGAYVLRTKDVGLPFDLVLRLNIPSRQEIEFESFATRFVEASGLVAIPPVVLKSIPESLEKRFARDLWRAAELTESQNPDDTRYSDSWNAVLHHKGKISVSVMVEGVEQGLALRNKVPPGDRVDAKKVWDFFGASVQRQLADLWAVTAVLGLLDLHLQNWLYKLDSGSVVGIDLADPGVFDSSEPLLFGHMRSPITGQANILSDARPLLLNGVSQAMKEFLKNVTPEQLRSIAVESNFSLTDRQVNGVLNRIVSLLEMISKSTTASLK